ncbi:cathepsin L1-like [Drosophila busckii]|nr:cathepsin L1-like [Drosophila busckii]
MNEHNKRFRAGLETFEMGVNQFSDLTFKEFEGLFLSSLTPDNASLAKESVYEPSGRAVPSSLDWRSQGAVTPVKNQGSCGSCWSFSANGALEGQWYLKTKKLISLSEQNLVDCSREKYGNHGCNGGGPASALQYVIDNGGINNQNTYPYVGKQNNCKYSKNAIAATVRSIAYVESNEGSLKTAVAEKGPISVAIDVTDNFKNYKSGVLNDRMCSTSVNHGVVVVGYGSDANGGDYWLVKNSWGTNWGEKGYIRMSRNRSNQCQIATYGVFTVV